MAAFSDPEVMAALQEGMHTLVLNYVNPNVLQV